MNEFRVLLVDDEAFDHELMSSYLKGSEYSLISARNVKEALASVDAEAPDIIHHRRDDAWRERVYSD